MPLEKTQFTEYLLQIPHLRVALEKAACYHSHLCPRMVLGARIGFAGAQALGVDVPSKDKGLLVIAETDGCFLSGLQAATGTAARHRTLRIVDYGKTAATLVNVKTEEAVRVVPRADVRERVEEYVRGEDRHYFAMLCGYQLMPDEVLLNIKPVRLVSSVTSLISRASVRVNCTFCGEEIMNEREVLQEGGYLCKSCAKPGYYME